MDEEILAIRALTLEVQALRAAVRRHREAATKAAADLDRNVVDRRYIADGLRRVLAISPSGPCRECGEAIDDDERADAVWMPREGRDPAGPWHAECAPAGPGLRRMGEEG